jgi:hypothetical protein
MRATNAQRDEVTVYFESQSQGEAVIHLERVASERVGGVLHDVWDVHTEEGRWWVVTEPMNLYTQEDFKSVSVVLTFHVGLAVRVADHQAVPVTDHAAAFLPQSWRRWEQAVEAMNYGAESEDFQAVGMRLRECLVSFAGEVQTDKLVPSGQTAPQAANVVAWCELLANTLAAGPSASHLRSYLKKMSRETWEYVNWLTHARNAGTLDAEIALSAVSHMLSTFTAARMRWGRSVTRRCVECDSTVVAGGWCRECGWTDPEYQPPPLSQISEEEWAARLAEPCTPTSDISTLITPEDYQR